MKKMWKFRKDSKAVSPVIATILMVAITVVLAAVLYVMVSGYGGGDSVPTGGFTTAEKTSTSNVDVKFAKFTPETKFSAVKFVVDGPNGAARTFWWTDSNLTTPIEILNVDGTTDANITLTDLGGDKIIGVGDYIGIDTNTATPSGGWALSCLYSGDVVAEKTWVF